MNPLHQLPSGGLLISWLLSRSRGEKVGVPRCVHLWVDDKVHGC
jgi:hypothetical protein